MNCVSSEGIGVDEVALSTLGAAAETFPKGYVSSREQLTGTLVDSEVSVDIDKINSVNVGVDDKESIEATDEGILAVGGLLIDDKTLTRSSAVASEDSRVMTGVESPVVTVFRGIVAIGNRGGLLFKGCRTRRRNSLGCCCS